MLLKIPLLITLLVIASCNTDSCNKNTLNPQKESQSLYDSDFEKLGEPEQGSWRSIYREEPQTLEDYLQEAKNIKSEANNTIYIQPLGEMNVTYTAVLKKMCEYAEIFFNCKTIILEQKPLFENCYVESRGQYNASSLTRWLVYSYKPDDTIAIIGITNVDLYSGTLNFVFGQGSLQDGAGVYSLRRLETTDETLFLRRSIGLMSHEMGHIFSIKHCVFYKCLMNGANSLAESDSQPLHLCPIDLEKLKCNVKFDTVEWYKKLMAFYKENNLQKEAEWVERRIANISK